jgi:hypothetical protein
VSLLVTPACWQLLLLRSLLLNAADPLYGVTGFVDVLGVRALLTSATGHGDDMLEYSGSGKRGVWMPPS